MNHHQNERQENSPSTHSDDWNKGSSGAAATGPQRAPGEGESPAADAYRNETGDPGRTPGSAEGVEDFEEKGNQ